MSLFSFLRARLGRDNAAALIEAERARLRQAALRRAYGYPDGHGISKVQLKLVQSTKLVGFNFRPDADWSPDRMPNNETAHAIVGVIEHHFPEDVRVYVRIVFDTRGKRLPAEAIGEGGIDRYPKKDDPHGTFVMKVHLHDHERKMWKALSGGLRDHAISQFRFMTVEMGIEAVSNGDIEKAAEPGVSPPGFFVYYIRFLPVMALAKSPLSDWAAKDGIADMLGP